MVIFIVGYMACGKSTIGRKLTKALGWNLYDTDTMVTQAQGRSVVEIFDQEGEEIFRQYERDALMQLCSMRENCIVSTGGGAPTWIDNMELMNSNGYTIYLRRTAENIASRISPYGRDKRPKLRGLNDVELVEVMSQGIAARESYYSQAQLVIDAAHYSDRMIVDIIISAINSVCK